MRNHMGIWIQNGPNGCTRSAVPVVLAEVALFPIRAISQKLGQAWWIRNWVWRWCPKRRWINWRLIYLTRHWLIFSVILVYGVILEHWGASMLYYLYYYPMLFIVILDSLLVWFYDWLSSWSWSLWWHHDNGDDDDTVIIMIFMMMMMIAIIIVLWGTVYTTEQNRLKACDIECQNKILVYVPTYISMSWTM